MVIIGTIGLVDLGALAWWLASVWSRAGDRGFPGVHAIAVPVAVVITPLMFVGGLLVLTGKAARAEPVSYSPTGKPSMGPIGTRGFVAACIGFFAQFYPVLTIAVVDMRTDTVERLRERQAMKERAQATSSRPVLPVDAAVPSLAQLDDAASLAEAIRRAGPQLGDGADNLGAHQLAHFASKKLVWTDVHVPSETSLPRVLKDAERERGKRLCITGTLLDIQRQDLDRRPIYIGALQTTEGDVARFIAVGSTGELLKRSAATLCGLVTGRADTAAMLVGMFDLPENMQPAVER
ncbi:MAG: hypothetical protein NT062_08920 [Proteobacteria bacterium]|nr:hypothetical protein [Pseudomonadota bacterium]